MSLDARTLYELLPAFYRTRDAESGGALKALIDVVAEQVALLEEDLEQLYDDQFIETCAEWVVPYIGDLVGYRRLHGIVPRISSPRAEVADTIGLRRGKGTAATLEELAQNVTGWDARVVEHYRTLATTPYMNHVRADLPAFSDIRRAEPMERLGGPFDPFAHSPELRGARSKRSPSTVAIFLWRLESLPVVQAPAAQVDAKRFLFSPYGTPLVLFTQGRPADGRVAAINVSHPLTRRGFAAAKDALYGSDGSVFIEGAALADTIVCDLSDADGGAWAHEPPAGKVAIDPQLGRIAFGTAPAEPPRVSFHYGAPAPLGAGGYTREASFDAAATESVPDPQPNLQAGLDAVAAGGVLEIADSGRYGDVAIRLTSAGARLELRAADQTTPFLALTRDLRITGVEGTTATLNGLALAGGAVRVAATAANALQRLRLRHCTLTPGIRRDAAGRPTRPEAPMLVVEAGTAVEIDRCIIGGIRAAPGATVTISNSIIDASAWDGVAYAAPGGTAAGGPVTIFNSTVIGKVHASELREASNTIFAARLAADDDWLAPVWAERRHHGCTRFCYLPPGSRAPRPYCCQPSSNDAAQVQPVFTSERFGDPGYGQLSRRTSRLIRAGAEDGAEMGVYRDLYQPQRETNLRVRLDEYLRFGLEAQIVFVT